MISSGEASHKTLQADIYILLNRSCCRFFFFDKINKIKSMKHII
jgi:hypothetical protein